MNSDTLRDPGGFATTRWSIVLAAGTNDTQAGAALGELCRLSWYPLYAFVRRQGPPPNSYPGTTFMVLDALVALGICLFAGFRAWRKIAGRPEQPVAASVPREPSIQP
jgi:hypothetical protein